MKILLTGATGATGKHLVHQLLEADHEVQAIVRSAEKFTKETRNHKNLSITTSTILDMSEEELITHIEWCDVIVSTLGHNLTFKGMFGNPRRLVTNSIKRLCQVIENKRINKSVKMILMNTVGCKNEDLKEKSSFSESCVFFILRYLLPPVSDNEKAVGYLRTTIGQNHPNIEWVVVRPDSLTNEDKTSTYATHPSPTHTLFKPAKTSRINVAHFISELISQQSLWSEWKGQMPVIYNSEN
tara:strand:- start:107 stop:829 length:723 start_codon:yes stop_codon:yes gene_type:complete